MQFKYIMLGVFIVLVLLFLRGSSISTRCGQIGNCSSCWKDLPVSTSGALCPNGGSCFADSADQEYNAWTDVLLCACDAAKSSNYADVQMNQKIEESIKIVKGYDVPAQALCDQPGVLLTKRLYG